MVHNPYIKILLTHEFRPDSNPNFGLNHSSNRQKTETVPFHDY